MNNRAYPDISFNGNNFLIITYINGSIIGINEDILYPLPVFGTSASSPSIAGLFALINDELLNKGQPPIGFLNPLLYQMAEEEPLAFHDIVQGNNFCNGNGGLW